MIGESPFGGFFFSPPDLSGTQEAIREFACMTESSHQILEDSFRIAWDYLQGIGLLGEPDAATKFLLEEIAGAMARGETRKLLLSNRAIDAYRKRRPARDFALVS